MKASQFLNTNYLTSPRNTPLKVGDVCVLLPISSAIDIRTGTVIDIRQAFNDADIITLTIDSTPEGYYVARRFELVKVEP